MGLDIRIPIGLMFAVVGAIVTIAGLVMNNEIYRSSLGININLQWGLVMLAFGLVMIYLGRRGGASAKPAEESVEGRRIEAMEHETGKEVETDVDI